MYIKLIQPKMRRRPMDTDIKLHMSPPLGLLTIANMLRDEHRIVIENENIERINFGDMPDIVGISVTVDTLPRAVEISRKFREKGCKVVAGGIHITTAASFVPEDAFDALCIGAAEGTWNDIVRDAELGELRPVYRCRHDLRGAEIVPPAYDMLEKGKYLYCNIVHTSRGCPFRCDFCYNSSAERGYIKREISDVVAEIKSLGTDHVMFIDDNLAGDPKWTREFLHAIMPLNLRWQAAVSINAAKDGELLDLMKESGCRSLFIGFESITPESVSGVHKVQNSAADYDAAVKAIHDRGIMINASFVFGLDGDTPGTFDATLDWIVRNRIETVTSHILTPYPGTVLYERMKAEGRITSDDLSLYNTANVVFKPAGMTAEELYNGYICIYKRIYSFRNIIRRLPETKDQRAAYLLFNLFYRKFGKFTDLVCKIVTYRNIGRLAEIWSALTRLSFRTGPACAAGSRQRDAGPETVTRNFYRKQTDR
ncbi:MAG: B12-binding domain-containing radical SAM protein [Ruminiclostridium sp.]|nr:B12-binding domain-containing radical SAM protein [Ruminiclostridium sp.]